MKPAHPSLWHVRHPTPQPAVEVLPESTDVVIVGAGISGLTAALCLVQAGRRICVIDMAAGVGHGDTGQTTAHTTQILDVGYSQICRDFGDAVAAEVARSHGAALDFIEAQVRAHPIDCQFQRLPAYLYAEEGQSSASVETERQAMQRLPLTVRQPQSVPLPFAVAAALELADQVQIDPLAYLQGLYRAIKADGGAVHFGVRMQAVTPDKQDGTLQVLTDRGKIRATDVIYATHVPPTKLALQTKLSPQRTYALAVRCRNPPPPGLYYDVAEPYHYIRTQPHAQAEVVIVGGCDHRSGSKEATQEAYAELETYTRKRFAVDEVVARWSGQVFEPVDGLPFIGKVPGEDHVYMIGGLSGHGISSGTLGAILCSESILGRPSPWAELYKPNRFKPLAQAADYLRHNLQTSKHMVKDRVKALFHRAEVKPHSGAVVREGAKLAAVYNDGQVLHVLSAVCPHAGCCVQWNAAELSWDCPCHGSRFGCMGNLLAGPATSDLEPFDQRPST